jgi:hypothetical protein
VISSSDSVQFLVSRLLPHLMKLDEDEDEEVVKLGRNVDEDEKRTHKRRNVIWTENRKKLVVGVNECTRLLGTVNTHLQDLP